MPKFNYPTGLFSPTSQDAEIYVPLALLNSFFSNTRQIYNFRFIVEIG